jgi:hypothetical protein
MTLSTIDLLASIVTTFLSAYTASLDLLRVHYPSTRLRISLQVHPKTFPESLVDPLEGTVYTPFPKVVVDGGPSREVVGKHTPLAAAS